MQAVVETLSNKKNLRVVFPQIRLHIIYMSASISEIRQSLKCLVISRIAGKQRNSTFGTPFA